MSTWQRELLDVLREVGWEKCNDWLNGHRLQELMGMETMESVFGFLYKHEDILWNYAQFGML